MTASQRGVVLIIADWQHTPTNNTGVNFLRTELNGLPSEPDQRQGSPKK
ncbi:MAG: hypothetical protein ACTJH9_08585 [Pseudoalteromonas sp.]